MTTSDPMVPISRPAPGSWALLLWGAVLMLSGIGIGVGATLLLHHPPRPLAGLLGGMGQPMERDDFRVEPIVDRMAHDLDLSASQKKAVTEAYAQSLSAIKKLRGDMVVALSAEHDALRDRLKQALTPLQFAQWDQRYEAMRGQLMPDANERRGPPPEGRPPRLGGSGPPDDPEGFGPGGGGPRPGEIPPPPPDGPDGPDDGPPPGPRGRPPRPQP